MVMKGGMIFDIYSSSYVTNVFILYRKSVILEFIFVCESGMYAKTMYVHGIFVFLKFGVEVKKSECYDIYIDLVRRKPIFV